LEAWPLPRPAPDAHKDARGRVLIAGGSEEIPGAALLAAEAALRIGAGKLTIATAPERAGALALHVPESRVVRFGSIVSTRPALKSHGEQNEFDAILIGPGFMDADQLARALTRGVVRRSPTASFVLDAGALGSWKWLPRSSDGKRPRGVLTPHAGELAALLRCSRETVEDEPRDCAQVLARTTGSVVVLKGATTYICSADGRCWVHALAVPGLATSGSGDVLAGAVAGLLARGAEAEQAAVWAVFLHARAGVRLARRIGSLGYLARELCGEFPPLLDALQRTRNAAQRGERRRHATPERLGATS
jgi:ADP-dependent NAD(P)H-hydrate dehydratase